MLKRKEKRFFLVPMTHSPLDINIMSKILYLLRKYHEYSKIIYFDQCPLKCFPTEWLLNTQGKAERKKKRK